MVHDLARSAKRVSSRWRVPHRHAFRQRRLRLAVESLESRCLLTTIELATLAADGITISGIAAADSSGVSVSSAGDFNGDGYDDVLIGARLADPGGSSAAGESYVVFGGATQVQAVDLDSLGAAGVKIFGDAANDSSGFSVSGAGDVNGDGFDDLIIGAWGADPPGTSRAGKSYVVFGEATPPLIINLGALGARGITISGISTNDYSGYSVSGAGDINGDGYDDVLIGAHKVNVGSETDAGESYLVFGQANPPQSLDLSALGTAGIKISGEDAGDLSGISVSSAGDFNGDGFDDMLIGADAADPNGTASGESYVVFGKVLPLNINLAFLGAAGVKVLGIAAQDQSGRSVSSAGDVNGDGFDDLLIGASAADSSSGESYVVFGKAIPPVTIHLSTLGAGGITITGIAAGDQSGRSVSSAGDVNGDGYDDLLIGAWAADPGAIVNAGESYVIFGEAAPPQTISLSTASTVGINIVGISANDNSGYSVSGAGDVNGDGFDDLLIGAKGADPGGESGAGESYVVFGSDFSAAVTHAGTAASETLTGDAAANVMVGGRGNDVLIGNGGADVLRGGEGDDVLAVSDLDFGRLVGGNGLDTLRMDTGGVHLDLTKLADNRILGVERIDLTGSGGNVVVLSLAEVLNISDESNTVAILGQWPDRVMLDAGWTEGPLENIDGLDFRLFNQDAATLKIAIGVNVFLPQDSIELADAGVTLYGADANDYSGRSVSSVGDVNGDGFDDLLIGAEGADAAGNARFRAGESYVIFGGPALPTTIDLGALGSAGLTLYGADTDDFSGFSVSSAGDVNGDGFDDLLIGADVADAAGNAKNVAGESYVVFGGPALPTTIDLGRWAAPDSPFTAPMPTTVVVLP